MLLKLIPQTDGYRKYLFDAIPNQPKSQPDPEPDFAQYVSIGKNEDTRREHNIGTPKKHTDKNSGLKMERER